VTQNDSNQLKNHIQICQYEKGTVKLVSRLEMVLLLAPLVFTEKFPNAI
jgi:hypothetical protein